MYAPHFEIHDGVLTKCRMSGEEKVTVTIPDGVTNIGNNAFMRCTALESITIPESVTSIGYNAFYHCDNLTICAPAGSYAIEYAKDNGIKFKEI